jgi:hypothetical protein
VLWSRHEPELSLKHLEQAERRIAEGKDHIARQEGIIARLVSCGHDTSEAEALLVTLLESQRLHEQHRRSILDELGL